MVGQLLTPASGKQSWKMALKMSFSCQDIKAFKSLYLFWTLQGYALYILVCCSDISTSNFCYKTTLLVFRPYCKREFERGPIIAQITSLLPTHYPYGSRIEERRRYMEHRITRTNPKNGKGNTDAIIVLHNIRFEICRWNRRNLINKLERKKWW